jgi:hypothetical protein
MSDLQIISADILQRPLPHVGQGVVGISQDTFQDMLHSRLPFDSKAIPRNNLSAM